MSQTAYYENTNIQRTTIERWLTNLGDTVLCSEVLLNHAGAYQEFALTRKDAPIFTTDSSQTLHQG